MLSNFYDFSVQEVTRKSKQNGVWNDEVIEKPTVICEYNKNMGGVGTADHYVTSYAFQRKTSKWWRKVFFWSIDVTMVNAYHLYKLSNEGNRNVRSLDFRRKLLVQLVGSVRNTAFIPRVNNGDESRLDNTFHAIHVKKHNFDCKVCSDRNRERKTTNYYCKTCPSFPCLHPGECFEKYHKLQNYR